MKRFTSLVSLTAVIVVLLVPASQARRTVALDARAPDPAEPSRLVPAERTWIIATDATPDEIEAMRVRVKEAGARSVNLVMPDGVIVCEMPVSKAKSSLAGVPGFQVRAEQDIGPQTVSAMGRRIDWMLEAHRMVDARRYGTRKPAVTAPGPPPGFRDVVVELSPQRLDEAQRAIEAALAARSKPWPVAARDQRLPNQNSEVLAGDIVAQFVFPQSNGIFEPSTETWTESDLVTARQGAYQMMLEWQSHFPKMDIHSTLYMVDRNGGGEPRTGGTHDADCDYEPIQHNMSDDELWVLNVVKNAFPTITEGVDDAIAATHLVNEWRRSRGYDWAFTAFVARSRNAPGNVFRDADYTAYASLGGPYLVQPFPSGRDPNELGELPVYSQILNHEGGHLFWTLDEYPGAPGNCGNSSGYLDYANKNITIVDPFSGNSSRCQELVPCIMHIHAREADWGIGFRPWCSWSRGQLGVIDNNDNGFPDVFEAAPIVEFAIEGPETLSTNLVSVQFRARASAVPNMNRAFGDGETAIDYASGVGDAFLTLGGSGKRIDLTPLDGGWGGELIEDFEFKIQLGSSGRNTISVVTKNRAGYSSRAFTKELYFIGVNYGKTDIQVYKDVVSLNWEVIGEDFGATYTVYRLEPGDDLPGTIIAEDVQPAGESTNGFVPYRVNDKKVVPGREYRYYVDGHIVLDIDGTLHEYTTESNIASATAMLEIPAGKLLSHASPNPFRDQVSVSVAVPATYTETTVGAQQLQQRVATSVDVSVYDVAGRRIRDLNRSTEFTSVLTLRWDGRDQNGRSVPSGVYFIKASAGELAGVTKVLLLR
jgi:hypothetical protein